MVVVDAGAVVVVAGSVVVDDAAVVVEDAGAVVVVELAGAAEVPGADVPFGAVPGSVGGAVPVSMGTVPVLV